MSEQDKAGPAPPAYLCGLDLGQAQDYSALVVAERTQLAAPQAPPAPSLPPDEAAARQRRRQQILGLHGQGWPPADVAAITGLGVAEVVRTLRTASGPPDEKPARVPSPPAVGHYAVRRITRWPLGTSYTEIAAQVTALVLRPPLPGCRLVVDATGVGTAVVEILRRALAEAKASVSLMPVLITAGHGKGGLERGTWSVPKKELVSVLQSLLQGQRLKFARLPERDMLVKELQTFKVKVSAATGHESFEAWRERDHDDMVLALALACWAGERPARRLWAA
jgi:hypothetical protein